jgi:hypothetical protein
MPHDARSERPRNAKPWQASRLHPCTVTCRGATCRPDGPWHSALHIPKDEAGAAPEGNLRVDSGSCTAQESGSCWSTRVSATALPTASAASGAQPSSPVVTGRTPMAGIPRTSTSFPAVWDLWRPAIRRQLLVRSQTLYPTQLWARGRDGLVLAGISSVNTVVPGTASEATCRVLADSCVSRRRPCTGRGPDGAQPLIGHQPATDKDERSRSA